MSYGMNSSQGVRSGGGRSGDITPKGYKTSQIQQFTPEQMGLFKQLFSHLGPDSFTSQLASGDQSAFDQMEAPALRQFGALQGNIASRFSGMGMGGRKSSGFQNTMNQASSDFAQSLQGQRMSYQQQAIKDLMGMSSDLLGQRPYDRQLVQKAPKWWEAPLNSFAGGVGQGAGKGMGAGISSFVGGLF